MVEAGGKGDKRKRLLFWRVLGVKSAAAEVLCINRGMRSVPIIVFPDGSVLVEPNARELTAKCLQEPEPSLGERLRSLFNGVVRREISRKLFFWPLLE